MLVIFTLALGSGALTAIFSVVHAFLLRPLPYPDGERLVRISSQRGNDELGVSAPDFFNWRERNRVFQDLALFTSSFHTNIVVRGQAASVRATYATAGIFPVLGVAPILGQAWGPESDHPGAEQVVVLGHGLWQRSYAGDPRVLGQVIQVEGENHTVIGVMPEEFAFPQRSQLWVPLEDAYGNPPRRLRRGSALARLKSGVSLEQARADMEAITALLSRQFPDSNDDVGVALVPEREVQVGDVRPYLRLLFGAALFVLLIACLNVTCLFLAHGIEQQGAFSVRAALGASHRQLACQPVLEGLLLALAGGAAGLLLARWGLGFLVDMLPAGLASWTEIEIDRHVWAFTLLIAVLSGCLAGLLPALRIARGNLNPLLRAAGTAGTAIRQVQVGRALVIAETALAVLLLVGAGLLLHSLARLQAVDPGFEAENVLTMEVGLPTATYPERQVRADLYQHLFQRLSLLPQVVAVGANTDLPLSGQVTWDRRELTAEGQSDEEQARNPLANAQQVSPDYFRALGIPLRAGRVFTDRDVIDAPQVAIVNQNLADYLWPGQDAVGQRIKRGGFTAAAPWMTVVGVVADTRHRALDQEVGFNLYLPCLQRVRSVLHLALRVRGDPWDLVPTLREEIWAVVPDLGIAEITTLDRLIGHSIWKPRLWSVVLLVFSFLGLTLAAVGIYGVVSYVVAQKTHEIAVRLAFGAQPRDLVTWLLGSVMKLALLGSLLGLALALLLGRLMRSLLYEVSGGDPAALFGALLLVFLTTLVATFFPIRRALRVELPSILRD